MAKSLWFVTAWKYTSAKGRIMITFGFFSLLTIFFGAVLMFMGIIGLFTIIGASHPNTDNVLQLLLYGLYFICGGTVGMIIYLIGMRFVPPPVLPENEITIEE